MRNSLLWGIIYLVLFAFERHNAIYNRIEYNISEKSGITESINHNFGKISIDSCNSLPIENIFTCHNIIILIKLVVLKNKNDYYYNIFLD